MYKPHPEFLTKKRTFWNIRYVRLSTVRLLVADGDVEVSDFQEQFCYL